MISERVRGPVGWLKRLPRFFGFSAVMFAAGVCVVGGIGCAEETFKCCECKFQCMGPDPVDPTMMTVQTDFTVCECPSEGYTYEECGIFCYKQLPAEVDVRAGGAVPPLSMCNTTPKQDSVLAKNSCSPGSPVGE